LSQVDFEEPCEWLHLAFLQERSGSPENVHFLVLEMVEEYQSSPRKRPGVVQASANTYEDEQKPIVVLSVLLDHTQHQ